MMMRQTLLAAALVLSGLSADTRYEYQAGWFSTERQDHTPETVKQIPLKWPPHLYTFKTTSNQPNRIRRYVTGSCRYLRLTAGIPSAPELGDRIFSAIGSLNQQRPLDAQAVDRIGPVEHDDGHAVLASRTQHVVQRADEGIEAHADVLHVENQDVHPG